MAGTYAKFNGDYFPDLLVGKLGNMGKKQQPQCSDPYAQKDGTGTIEWSNLGYYWQITEQPYKGKVLYRSSDPSDPITFPPLTGWKVEAGSGAQGTPKLTAIAKA